MTLKKTFAMLCFVALTFSLGLGLATVISSEVQALPCTANDYCIKQIPCDPPVAGFTIKVHYDSSVLDEGVTVACCGNITYVSACTREIIPL